jgi:hypothetical protein
LSEVILYGGLWRTLFLVLTPLDGSVHFLHNNKGLFVEEIRQKSKKQEKLALSA